MLNVSWFEIRTVFLTVEDVNPLTAGRDIILRMHLAGLALPGNAYQRGPALSALRRSAAAAVLPYFSAMVNAVCPSDVRCCMSALYVRTEKCRVVAGWSFTSSA